MGKRTYKEVVEKYLYGPTITVPPYIDATKSPSAAYNYGVEDARRRLRDLLAEAELGS